METSSVTQSGNVNFPGKSTSAGGSSTGDSGVAPSQGGGLGDGVLWDMVPEASELAGESRMATRSFTASLRGDDNAIHKGGSKGGSSGAPVPPPAGGGPGRSGNSGHEGHGQGEPPGGGGSGAGAAGSSGGGGGRSADAGNEPPHPGRSVGGGDSPGKPNYAGEGPALLISKMLIEPLRDPVPVGAQFLPCDTEEIVVEREQKGSSYSPVMWADPLIPINISVGSTSSAINELPATGTSINNAYDTVQPVMTKEGLLIRNILESEGPPTIIRSMLPVKGMKDMGSMISLLETSDRVGFQSLTDHAPLIRLGLLMHCLAPLEWLGYSTSVVQNMCVNGYADLSKMARTWTSAPTETSKTAIGTGDNVSTLYWRTLGQYCRLINAQATDSDRLMTNSGKDIVDLNEVRFIPVKMSWRGQSWLGAYILAHTTTLWWNHAVKISIPVKIHDQKTSSNTLNISCLPKASTVYVPGVYKYICLVVVDTSEATVSRDIDYHIGNNYKATYTGNAGFAKIAYKLIGRVVETNSLSLSLTDCFAAWKTMCGGLLSHVSPRSVEVMLSVLATSRFSGFGVWTDAANPKKKKSIEEDLNQIGLDEVPGDIGEWVTFLSNLRQAVSDEGADTDDTVSSEAAARYEMASRLFQTVMTGVTDDENVDHVGGVTCADPKTDIKIGDHTIPDWFTSYNTTANMPDRVKFYTWWRVDPLHRLAQGRISCTDGSKPNLGKFVSGEIQYEIKECSDLVRILSYAGIYEDNSRCSNAVQGPVDILNRSLGYGSLMLGLTEFWRASSGLPLFDYNQVGNSWKLVDPQLKDISCSMTNGFISSSHNSTMVTWSDKTFDILGVVKNAIGITDEYWTEHWYGGVVPWWYVQAILTKFEGQVSVRTKGNTSVKLDFDKEWYDETGYHIKTPDSVSTDLSVLTSTTCYEKAVQRRSEGYFTILTPTRDGHKMSVHWTSWYYNYINDIAKTGLRRRTRVARPDYDGVVELNCITFPEVRTYKGYAHPEAFVAQNNRYVVPLDQTIRGGLTWPDPLVDWLKEGFVAMGPHLLKLDVVGAVGAALGHINKTILDYLEEKIHGSQSFRD